ncbi:TraB/GumN family protein [Salipaludibacillus daqingensis]|uniref:TraB/GumN family protein n=1 Tax=Salipaludibacillus daqingensis TaxID=3041001 RepID=UPI002473CCF3|nr:TraB/GumN family protein [Salipaludibacillus daqingensis]
MRKSLGMKQGLIGTLVLLAACSPSDDGEVSFSDDGLEDAVQETAGTEGELTAEEVESIEHLEAVDAGITNIEGIESLNSLKTIDFRENAIEDFEPLLALDHLEEIHVGDVFFTEDIEQNNAIEEVMTKLEDDGVEIDARTRLAFPEHDGVSNGLFYEVTHDDQTVYLFGSIHVGDESLYPLRDEVESAFAESSSLSVEIDIDDINEMEASATMMNMGSFHNDDTLRNYVEDDTFEEISGYLSEFMIPAEYIEQFQPWFVSMLLNDWGREQTDLTGDEGIDQYFIDEANERDLEIISLETLESQLQTISSAPLDEQTDGLHATLDGLEIYEEEMEQMLNLWKKGDVDVFEHLRDNDDEHGTEMMDMRDEEMANQIVDYLESGSGESYFVVVGALHLAGDTSIPGLLEAEGYDVTFVE